MRTVVGSGLRRVVKKCEKGEKDNCIKLHGYGLSL
jgi:hypothetical protein